MVLGTFNQADFDAARADFNNLYCIAAKDQNKPISGLFVNTDPQRASFNRESYFQAEKTRLAIADGKGADILQKANDYGAKLKPARKFDTTNDIVRYIKGLEGAEASDFTRKSGLQKISPTYWHAGAKGSPAQKLECMYKAQMENIEKGGQRGKDYALSAYAAYQNGLGIAEVSSSDPGWAVQGNIGGPYQPGENNLGVMHRMIGKQIAEQVEAARRSGQSEVNIAGVKLAVADFDNKTQELKQELQQGNLDLLSTTVGKDNKLSASHVVSVAPARATPSASQPLMHNGWIDLKVAQAANPNSALGRMASSGASHIAVNGDKVSVMHSGQKYDMDRYEFSKWLRNQSDAQGHPLSRHGQGGKFEMFDSIAHEMQVQPQPIQAMQPQPQLLQPMQHQSAQHPHTQINQKPIEFKVLNPNNSIRRLAEAAGKDGVTMIRIDSQMNPHTGKMEISNVSMLNARGQEVFKGNGADLQKWCDGHGIGMNQTSGGSVNMLKALNYDVGQIVQQQPHVPAPQPPLYDLLDKAGIGNALHTMGNLQQTHTNKILSKIETGPDRQDPKKQVVKLQFASDAQAKSFAETYEAQTKVKLTMKGNEVIIGQDKLAYLTNKKPAEVNQSIQNYQGAQVTHSAAGVQAALQKLAAPASAAPFHAVSNDRSAQRR